MKNLYLFINAINYLAFSKKTFLTILFCFIYSSIADAQIIINEIQADAGQSEGQNEAFVELKTGGSSVNLDCWVLTNGKWAIRFPNITVAANAHFVIGCGEDANSSGAGASASEPGGPTSGLTCDICDFPGLPLDFDVCNASNAQFYDPSANGFSLNSFTDQIILFRDDGTIQDAIKINAGDLPAAGYILGTNVGVDNVLFVPNPSCGNVTFEMPALSSSEYQPFSGSGTNECNRSISKIGNSWSLDNHPTPGADNSSESWAIKVSSNGGSFEDLDDANLVFCSNPNIVIRLEVYNYQHVEPNMMDHSGNTGSYIYNPITTNEEAWTVVATGDNNNGTTVFEYSINGSIFSGLGSYRFDLFWEDFTNILGSGVVPPSSSSNCYERENITVVIVQPLSVSNTDVSCPEDFNQGIIDIGSLVTGGYQNTYELYSNSGSLLESNTFGVFAIANVSQGPFVVKIVNGASSNCAPPFIEVDINANCAAEPTCPENTNLAINASNPICTNTDIEICFDGEALPLGGTVNLYLTNATETDYLNGTSIDAIDINLAGSGGGNGTSFDLTWNFDDGGVGDPGGGAVSSDPTQATAPNPPKKYKGSSIDTDVCLFESVDGQQCSSDYLNDKSLAVCNWSATQTDFFLNASYLEFCLDVRDCGLNVQEISFDMGRSGDGPENVWVTKGIEPDISTLIQNTSPRILGTHYQSTTTCAPVVIPVSGLSLQANDNWCFYMYVNKDNDSAASFDCEPPTNAGAGCRRIYLDDVKVTMTSTCNDPSLGISLDTCVNYTIDQEVCDGGNDYKIWSVISPFGDNCPEGGADDATAILTEPISVSCPSLTISETFVEVCEGDNASVTVTINNGISGFYELSYDVFSDAGNSLDQNAPSASGNVFTIPINSSVSGNFEYNLDIFTDGACATFLQDLGFTVQVYATDDVSISGSTNGNCSNPGSVTLDFGNNDSPPWTVTYEINGISYTETFYNNPTSIDVSNSGTFELISAFNSACPMGIGSNSIATINIANAPEITSSLAGGATIFVDENGNPMNTIDLSVYEEGIPLSGTFCWYYVNPNDPAFNEVPHLIQNTNAFVSSISTIIYLVYTIDGVCGNLGESCYTLEPLNITVIEEIEECSMDIEIAGIPEAPAVTEICFQEPGVDFAASPGYGNDPLQAGTIHYLYLIYGPNSISDIYEINFDGAFTVTQPGVYFVNGIEVNYVAMQNAGIDISTITTEVELLTLLANNDICASNISPGYQLFVFPESNIDCIQTSCQLNIPMPYAGWHMISSYCNPDPDSITQVFAPIVNDVIQVKNLTGQVYVPSFNNFNTFTTWDITQGYLVKTANPVTLPINGGEAVNLTIDQIPLYAGWNMIAYWLVGDADPNDVFSAIANDVIQVKDLNGAYVPSFNDFNNMGNMTTTRGYQVKMNAPQTLTYSSSDILPRPAPGSLGEIERLSPIHFTKNIKPNPNTSTMIIMNDENNLMNYGDEIGVFTSDGILVGAYVYENDMMGGLVFGDDETEEGKDGILENEEYIFKVWDRLMDTEREVEMEFIQGNATYLKDDLCAVSFKYDGVGLSEIEGLNASISPNPVSSKLLFDLDLASPEFLTIEIFKIDGQLVDVVAKQSFNNGNTQLVYDVSELNNGLYMCRVTNGKEFYIKRLTIIK